ncbi:protein-glutamate methylesterase/protein-glutamine glutaminase [Chitinimonas sp. BJB300]|uniref:protein-glutamate methylesterase/protein-glutamine glutaminase n=1 Tax=Chitinimonas sp. BJB300 TaxID=1559339 RepID=UPI000C0CAE52|nr:chemotaxis response regulator protein-glutamate methylesterase [Chitinimonas sp. BJB300]PHV10987.1 chemotaxis response regulator protein-glutamate methylesterase [Chitinimonas sp. BJB300]TSJ87543.1 chemotaxis response regulator protein-glutamate methylesterase [Chitinimonas sp. BJB300]
MKTIKVVVVDDSALIRQLLTEIINKSADLRVVGVAADPIAARELIRTANPDVITLDIEMPRMDGLDFLEKLMRLRPTPVVMISTLTEQGSAAAVRALQLGAVDVIAKPRLDVVQSMQQYAEELCERLRNASRTRPRRLMTVETAVHTADSVLEKRTRSVLGATEKIVVIGSSTGGTEALKEVLMALPADGPAVLIAQHMPEAFTRSFANRLNTLCRMVVKEAEHGERVLPGHAYVAPGHSHMLLTRSGANYVIGLSQGPEVNRHRPSVDVLFRSVANVAGSNAIGAILTGMGKDGAQGMLEMHQVGIWTVAQDEATCVVFGMPKEAIALGGVDEVVPLEKIGATLMGRLRGMGYANRV